MFTGLNKRYNSGTVKWRDVQGKVWEAGHEASMTSSGMLPSQHLNVVTVLESSLNPIVLEFLQSSISSLYLFFLEVGQQGWKFQLSNLLVFQIVQAHPEAIQECHPKSPNQHKFRCDGKGLIIRHSYQEIKKVLGALCQEPGKKIKYIFVSCYTIF